MIHIYYIAQNASPLYFHAHTPSFYLSIYIENTWLVVSLFLMGKLGITSAFGTSKFFIGNHFDIEKYFWTLFTNHIYIYYIHLAYVATAEMIPTVIRSLGVGSASTVARLGALVAPFVPLLVGDGTFFWCVYTHIASFTENFVCILYFIRRIISIDHYHCCCSVVSHYWPAYLHLYYLKLWANSYLIRWVCEIKLSNFFLFSISIWMNKPIYCARLRRLNESERKIRTSHILPCLILHKINRNKLPFRFNTNERNYKWFVWKT